MKSMPFYCAGKTDALRCAIHELKNHDCTIATEKPDIPCCVVLDVPSFSPDGNLRSGENPNTLFGGLHPDSIIFGGNLQQLPFPEFRKIDLLKDELYLEANARITAYCSLMLAAQALPVTLEEATTLVIGWGRIGRVLSDRLKKLGAPITVAARNPVHLQILRSLGYTAAPLEQIPVDRFRLIINTVPSPVLNCAALNAVKLDLATVRGLSGTDVIHARGLPGIYAPESSGNLIAKTILHHFEEMNS